MMTLSFITPDTSTGWWMIPVVPILTAHKVPCLKVFNVTENTGSN